jgi:hypothetical protein
LCLANNMSIAITYQSSGATTTLIYAQIIHSLTLPNSTYLHKANDPIDNNLTI